MPCKGPAGVLVLGQHSPPPSPSAAVPFNALTPRVMMDTLVYLAGMLAARLPCKLPSPAEVTLRRVPPRSSASSCTWVSPLMSLVLTEMVSGSPHLTSTLTSDPGKARCKALPGETSTLQGEESGLQNHFLAVSIACDSPPKRPPCLVMEEKGACPACRARRALRSVAATCIDEREWRTPLLQAKKYGIRTVLHGTERCNTSYRSRIVFGRGGKHGLVPALS